jgi:hypothetical protein
MENMRKVKSLVVLLVFSIMISLTNIQVFAQTSSESLIKSIIIENGLTKDDKYIEVVLNINDPENYIVDSILLVSKEELTYAPNRKFFQGIVKSKSDKEIKDSITVTKKTYISSTITISRGVYVGEVKNGKANGYGKVFYKDNGGWCEGYWINDEPNGYCKADRGDSKIEGNLINGYLNGIGKLSIRDDKTKTFTDYIGNFKDGEKDGQFLVIANDFSVIITYKDDLAQGVVYQICNNGTINKFMYKDGNEVKVSGSQNTNVPVIPTIPTIPTVQGNTDKQKQLYELEKQRYESKLSEKATAIENIRNNKNIKQLVKQADGSFQFEYVCDEVKLNQAQKDYDDWNNLYQKWLIINS